MGIEKKKKNRNQPKQGYRADLKLYCNTKIRVRLNGGREVEGVMVGYDPFMNLVMDKAFEVTRTDRKLINKAVIRGSSIVLWEMLELVN